MPDAWGRQCCGECIHYLKEGCENGQYVGKCENKESVWEGMKRAETSGIFCPDFEGIDTTLWEPIE